jgi:hypothetical protein
MKPAKLEHLLALAFACLLLSAATMAQVKTETGTSKETATVETKVERAEVVYASGNDVVVKMENGEIRNFPNVPDSVKVTVDGQQLSVHDLKPGMKLERTITTTTQPQTVTTVKTVTGTIWHVNPPNSVVLTLDDGTNQKFNIPQGQKFKVDGKDVDAFHLKKGMKISATKVVTEPQTVTSEQRKITGQMPPPPPTEAMQGPVLIASAQTKPTEPAQAEPAQTEKSPEKIPQTASELPATGLIGIVLILMGVVAFKLGRAHSG